jgi:integrase
MLNASSLPTPWTWPVNVERYDRTTELKQQEITALERNLPLLERGVLPFNVMRQARVHRLLDPLEDVFTHVGFQRNRRPAMKILLLQEMLNRGRSLWGWNEDEWLETINKSGRDRHFVTAVAYLLCELDCLHRLGRRNFVFCCLAHRVFGRERLRALFSEVKEMLVGWGYREKVAGTYVPRVLCELLVTNRSPKLEDLTLELLQTVERRRVSATSTWCLSVLSKVLASRGIISAPIMRMNKPKRANPELTAGVPEKWVQAAKYWHENGTRSARLRRADYYFVLAVGRWLAAEHPTITAPDQWDRNLAIQCLTMITNMRCGDWRAPGVAPWGSRKHYGRPLKPATKMQNYTAIRTFFGDLQEWGVIPPRFDPYRSFTPPRSVKALIGSSPRVIADDIWAKLLWAGLNLTPEDFVRGYKSNGEIHTFHPIEMVRALTVVWLFAGLRGDEIRRLPLGCVRWQQDNASSVCFLDVPVNKTGTAFTKPVDKIVGQAINAWEKIRPPQVKLCDKKTGEMVDFLFLHRMRPIGEFFINKYLIPRLCRKAGVPQNDVRGPITSHRARSTIATQLFNAKEPMSLFELQEWLGHRLPSSTQRYAKITPTKLMKSYSDAGYFGRNLRAIEVLIDQEKVRAGVGAEEAWKFNDLGHGYCTYDFFDQCPHRMACAKCSFYMPKGATAAVLVEGKSNLLRMRQEIPLTDAEMAALDDGVSALESLLNRLADVPTPAGQTPVQLRAESLVQIDTVQAAD